LLSFLFLLAPLGTASAATTLNRGLSISPLRQYLNVNAGSQQKSSFTVGNMTDRTITVALSAKQFSVADYTYDYRFSDPKNDWLKLSLTGVSLKPGESRNIPYAVSIPAGTAPGGHYYTLFASADLSTSGLKSTVQAATLLYLTVNGKLVKTGHLQRSSIQHIAFGKEISYTVEPINTGNVYYFVYVTGELHGLFVKSDSTPAGHLLIPNAVRRISDTIPSPVLPGVYKATYGYKTDTGTTVMKSSYVLFIPPWFIALLLVIILLSTKFRPHKKKSPEQDTETKS